MTHLVDTSVLVSAMRDASGATAFRLFSTVGSGSIVLARPVELELLAGAIDETEWATINAYVAGRPMLEVKPDDWARAARMFFDMWRQGLTVRKLLDCCIARLAIDHGLSLVHSDRDFELIARVHPLQQVRL